MNLPPELLAHIASFLVTESLLACISVSRYWNQVFTPYLWHTVNVSEQPWSRLFIVDHPFPRRPSQRRQHLVRNLIRRLGQDIRVLEMDTAWLLWGSMLGHVNSLLSLTFHRIYRPALEWPDLEFEAYHIESSEAIPYSIFDIFDPSDYYCPEFKKVLACWHMALNNKALRRLEFPHEVHDYFTLQPQEDGDYSYYDLKPEGKQFLINILSSLPDLRHMEIGQDSDSFLLTSLAELFPKLTSFVHMGTASLKPIILLKPPKLHQCLQTLKIRASKFLSLDAEHLRWIVTAFPGLRQLSVPGYSSREFLGSLEGWDDIEDLSITSLEVFDLSSMPTKEDQSMFEEARITFHAVKKLKWTGEDYESPGDLFRTLRLFPALERFEFSSDAVFMDPSADGGSIPGRDSVYRFKTLVLGVDAAVGLENIEQLLFQSPFLTRVELHRIHPVDVRVLANCCQALEYLHFDTYEPCSLELNYLFVRCSELKECTGEYHLVEAIDILRSPHWLCLGLKKLDITIVYVPRAKGEQERMLEKVRRKLRRVRGQHIQDMDGAICEVQSTHNPQTKSRRCQEKVLSRLAKLGQLQEIDFRFRSSGQWGHEGTEFYDRLEPLEFTLESGLAELGGLDRLEKIAFKIEEDKFGQKERDWMWERWSMKEKPGEEGVFCVEDLM